MKRVATAVALVVIFLSASSVHATISLGFVPSVQNVSVGSVAQVAIKISGLGNLTAPSLGAYDLNINFNTVILSFNTVTYGDPVLGDQLDLFGLGNIQATTPGTGTVNLFELSLDSVDDLNNLQAPDFVLATLTFDTLATGISPLDLTVNALGDALGDPLSSETGSGSLTVEPAVIGSVPEPSTIVLVALGFFLLQWNRRRFSVRW